MNLHEPLFLRRTKTDLPPLLDLAALFDDTFSIDWIEELSGRKPTEILLVLEEGCKKELLTKRSPGVFCFVDLQERQRLLDHWSPKDKTRLHRLIAELLLREISDESNKLQAIEPHLLHISNNEEYCQLLIAAGDANRKNFKNAEALQCYAKAIKDLAGLHGQDADYLFSKAALGYSKVSMARHQTTKVISVLHQAIQRAKKCNDLSFQAQIKMQLAKNRWLRSQYNSALKNFKEGWSMVEQLNDPRLSHSATVFRFFFLIWQGRFSEAVRIYEEFIPDVWEYPTGRFPLYAAQTMGYCYTQIGEMTQGIGMLDTIRIHCLEKGEKWVAAHAGITMGSAFLEIDNIDDALKWLHWSLNEASPKHNEWTAIWGKLMLSYAYYCKSEVKKSVKYLDEFLQGSRRAQVNVRPYPYLMELCWAMEQGRIPRVHGLSIEKELNRMIKGGNVYIKGVAYKYRALLQRRVGEPHGKIMNSLNLSLKWLEASGHKIGIAKSQLEVARQYLLRGDEGKAKEWTAWAYDVLSPFNEELIPDDLRPLVKDFRLGDNLLKEILNLSQKLVTIENNKDLIQHIILTVNRIIGAERGAMFLLEDTFVRLRASRNLSPEETTHPDFEPALKVIADVARTGKSCLKQMSPKNNVVSPSFESIRSCICVPMRIRNKILGVLYYDNRLLSTAFKNEDLDLLAYFAGQAALCLDNAMIHEKIEVFNRKKKVRDQDYEDNLSPKLHFEEIIGESPALKRVLVQVDQVAFTDATVLIMGETGVGKELLARAIQRQSPRRHKPFIVVNCTTMPENLISSELFGHEMGAYTGAVRKRIGRFELADHGTLFLDEIGDLPMDIQVRLLRALENKEFERVGGNETIKSDFRLIVATNRDLEQAVKTNNFRDDLYYRISGFPIWVPPLRARIKDIPLLAHYFLRVFSTKLKKIFNGIPEEEMDKLIRYDWPGNVREMKNVIEWGVILSNEPFFRLPEIFMKKSEIKLHEGNHPSLKDNEYHHILSTLLRTGWKVRGPGGAAEILDLHPSTLESKMKKLGISRPKDIKRGSTLSKGS